VKKIFVTLLFALGLFSCQPAASEMDWLVGSWQHTTAAMDFHENWSKIDTQHYRGESYILVKKDTVFYEQIDLVQTKMGWDYSVAVRNQNKEQAVTFSSIEMTNDTFVFENKKHDYPNRIVYKKIREDSLVATIFGTQKGKPVSEDFQMKKTHP
jgi:hypothetical protein